MDINEKTREDIAKEVIAEVKAKEALDEVKNKQKHNINKKSKEEMLNDIIEYARNRCDGYIEDDQCDCEYCDGAFAACRKVLRLAGEDVSKYE